MKSTLKKCTVFLLAALLCVACIGSAFGVYSTPDTRTATLHAVDACHLAADWNSWDTTNGSLMAYSNGTYTATAVAVSAGQSFKVYNGTTATWINTVNGATAVPYAIPDNVALVQGTYNIAYTPDSGILIIDTETRHLFKCPSRIPDAGAVVLAWMWGGASDADSWMATTYCGTVGGYAYYALPITTDHTGCNLVRFAGGTTPATANWDNKWEQTDNVALSGTSGVVDATSSW